jgi:hypothetical protein
MKFFVPEVENAAQAERVYEAIRKFHIEQLDASLSARRIYRVRGTHNGKRFAATVGEPFEVLREVVIAILLDEKRKCYLICTPNRGVIKNVPYLSGAHEIDHSEDFEA